MDLYLTYEEYVETYGGTLEETEFLLYEFRAQKLIDSMTAGRVATMETIPDAVKMLIVQLITIDSTSGSVAQSTNPTVTSFNTDGYSESYGNAYDADEADKQMKSTIRAMLAGERDDNGVLLLYRGVNVPPWMMGG